MFVFMGFASKKSWNKASNIIGLILIIFYITTVFTNGLRNIPIIFSPSAELGFSGTLGVLILSIISLFRVNCPPFYLAIAVASIFMFIVGLYSGNYEVKTFINFFTVMVTVIVAKIYSWEKPNLKSEYSKDFG